MHARDAENVNDLAKNKYHTVDNINETKHYNGQGRPKKVRPELVKYQVEVTVQRDQESIHQQIMRKVDLY